MTVPTPEPANIETKEESYLKDVAVLQKAQAQADSALQAAIDALEAQLAPLTYFSGWQDIAYNTGYSSTSGGQLRYCVVGRQVFLRGGAFRDAGDYSATVDRIPANIPATDVNGESLRPLAVHRFSNWGTLRRTGSVEIETDGDITVRVPDNPDIDVDETAGVLDRSLDSPFQWIGLSTTYLRV